MTKKILYLFSIVLYFNSLFAQHDEDTLKTLEHIHIFKERFSTLPGGFISSDIKYFDIKYFDKNPNSSLANSLEKVPGFRSIQTGSLIGKPVIRGFSQNRVVISEFRIKHEGQQWGLEHGLELDPILVDRLEFLKGAASIVLGSDAMGGALQILNPIIPTKDTVSTLISTGFRSNDLGYNFGVKNLIVKKDFFFLTRFKYENFASYKTTKDHFEFNGKEYELHDRRLLNSGGETYTAAFQTGIRKKWGYSDLNFSFNQQKVGLMHFEEHEDSHHEEDGHINHRNYDLPYQQINHFKIVSNTHFHIKETDVDLDLAYQLNIRKEFEEEHHDHSHEEHSSHEPALELRLHTLSANLKFNRYFSNHLRLNYGLNGSHQINNSLGHEYLLANYKTFQTGLYGLVNYHINNQWDAVLGLRADFINQNAETFIDAEGVLSNAFNKNRLMYAASLGSKYDLSEKWAMKLNVASTYRFPQLIELTANGIHHGAARHEKGNQNLTIESGIQNDLSVYYRKEKLKINFTPFLNYYTNFIYLSNTNTFSPIDSTKYIYEYRQAPAIYFGGEISIDYIFNKYVSNHFGVEYVWNENKGTKMAMPFTPPLSLMYEISFKPFVNKFENLFIDLTGHYFAKQNRVDEFEVKTNDYFLLHLAVGNTFNIKKHQLNVSLNIRNLTNQYYLNNMSRYRVYNIPEQGINAQIQVRYSF